MTQTFSQFTFITFPTIFTLAIFASVFSHSAVAGIVADFSKESAVDCIAPCAVYFDATSTDDSSTQLDFGEINYHWNFGDVYDVFPTTGRDRNTGLGPIVGHVYESAASPHTDYTVTLEVTGPTGLTDTKTETIRVLNADHYYAGTKTICVSNDSNYGSNCPIGASKIQKETSEDLSSLISSGKRVLLEAGNTWHNVSTIEPGSNVRLGCYSGNGLNCVGNSRPLLNFPNGGTGIRFSGGAKNVTVSDLRIQGGSTRGSDWAFEAPSGAANQDILVHRVDAVADSWGRAFRPNCTGTQEPSTCPERIAISEYTAFAVGDGSGGNHWIGGCRKCMMLGIDFRDPKGEHIVRVQYADGLVVSNSRIDGSTDDKTCLNLRSFNNKPSRKINVYHNIVRSNWGSGISFCSEINSSQPDASCNDVVIDANFLEDSVYGQDSNNMKFGVHLKNGGSANSDRMWVRNNICNMDNFGKKEGGKGACINLQAGGNVFAYNNTAYSTDSQWANGPDLIRIKGNGTYVVRNNLIYAPNASSASAIDGGGNLVSSNNKNNVSDPFVGGTSSSDPGFYRLKASADEAIGQGWSGSGGFTAGLPLFDFGLNRIESSSRDIGAWYSGSGPPPGKLSRPGIPKVLQ